MATLYDPNKDEDQQNQDGTQPVQQVTSGQPSTFQGVTAQPQTVGPSKTAQLGSGRFTNIQKYIQANKAADYAGQIGQDVASKQQQFQETLGKAAQGVESRANPELQRLQSASSVIGQATIDPTKFAANQENVSALSNILGGKYLKNVGPSEQEQSSLLEQRRKLQEQAELSKSEQGRFQLLKNVFGGGAGANYGVGKGRLDQLLLQGKSGQLKQLGQQTGQAAQQAQTGLTQLGQKSTELGQQIGQLGQQAQTQAGEQLGKTSTDLQTALEERRKQTEAARVGEFTTTKDALKRLAESGVIDAATAAKLGIKAGTSLYGLGAEDLQQFLSKSNEQVTNVATEEEAARLNALATLSGHPEMANYVAGGQLGEATKFDTTNLETLVSGKKQSFENTVRDIKTTNDRNYQLANDIISMPGGPIRTKLGDAITGLKQFLKNNLGIAQGNPTGKEAQDILNVADWWQNKPDAGEVGAKMREIATNIRQNQARHANISPFASYSAATGQATLRNPIKIEGQ